MTTKKKINKADYMFTDKEGEHNLIKMPGQIDGRQFKIKGLKDCTVYLYDHTSCVSFKPIISYLLFLSSIRSKYLFFNLSIVSCIGVKGFLIS